MKDSLKYLLIILLICFVIFSFIEYKKIVNLNIEKSNLQSEKEELKIKVENLSTNLTIIQGEIQSNINLIKEYKEEIETSMSWFNTNSNLSKGIDSNYLSHYCYDMFYNKCEIKLSCIYLINSEFLGLEYKLDIKTSQKEDKLQSLQEFINNKGGDCEDYALFYKAEYNYILQDCINKGANTFNLESYESSLEPKDKAWLDIQKSWYLTYAKEKVLPSEYIYPNIVCGNIYDLNSENISGHCIIAFTKKKIMTTEDLSELYKSPLVEPQTGEFMGLINDESSGIYLLDNNTGYTSSYIYEIITDNDLFYFIDGNGWVSYSLFKEKLENENQKLVRLTIFQNI